MVVLSADILWVNSSTSVVNPLLFILHFFSRLYFNLALPSFHHPLNQSSILFKSFLKVAIPLSILGLQNDCFLCMMWSILTPTFSQTNNVLALATYLSSDKFLIGLSFRNFCSFHSNVWLTKLYLYYVGLEYLLFPLHALFKSGAGEMDFQ